MFTTFYPMALDNFGEHIWNRRILFVNIYSKISIIFSKQGQSVALSSRKLAIGRKF